MGRRSARPPRGLPRMARPLLIAAAVATLVAAGGVLGTTYAGRGSSRSTTTTTQTRLPPSTTTTKPDTVVGADGTYAVTSTTFDAGTTGAPAATPGAHLATTVWFPVSSARARAKAEHDSHPRYPLLVFSQGFQIAPARYQVLLEAWASAGFVVAAPTYPHTDDPPATFLDENDIVNHPTELRTVIGAVLAMASRPGSPFFRLVNVSEIGLVGQSDGGDVSLAVAADTCCRYPGVKAVAVLSGAELSSFDGTYFSPAPVQAPPLLVVQGSADTINVPACSAQVYDVAPAPKWYLDLLGAPHLTPYVAANSYEHVVALVTTDFFDAELAGQPGASSAMNRDGNASGVAQLSEGSTAPPSNGTCPGAP